MTSAKAIVAAIGGFITVLSTALADNLFSGGDWANIAAGAVAAILTIFGVWKTSNNPEN